MMMNLLHIREKDSQKKKQKQIVEQQSQEIASLKSDIEEIKQMLSQVLRGK
jgi:hypothetical protein